MSTNTSALTYPTAEIPETSGNLDINSTSLYAIVPRANCTTDQPDDWMITCCAPNAAQLAIDGTTGPCWEWCDLPTQYTNWTSDSGEILNQFGSCIRTASGINSTSAPKITVLVNGDIGGCDVAFADMIRAFKKSIHQYIIYCAFIWPI